MNSSPLGQAMPKRVMRVIEWGQEMSRASIQPILKRIYESVAELERRFPGRRFTPDGHMVGSIGEVLAEEKYDITLLPSNTAKHDATDPQGRRIQIRTTQIKSAPLKEKPDYLIVQRLNPDATTEEIFNGPGDIAWELTMDRKFDKNGQCNIGLGRFKKAQEKVRQDDRIPLRKAPPAGKDGQSA